MRMFILIALTAVTFTTTGKLPRMMEPRKPPFSASMVSVALIGPH